ncbi:MAG: lipid-A-disaccharide synthase [bacterium]|nr:lipid-A-disaccharide synthase [bacterium]
MNVCFLAGETSGDLHGAGVVAALRKLSPHCECWGMGGERMREAGLEVVVDAREMAVMGFIEVFKHLPVIKRNNDLLHREVKRRKPDVVIAIDYPGFNLRFAQWLRTEFSSGNYRPKTLGYISPQVWAWKAGRIKQISERYDGLAVVFPFEVDTYKNAPLDVRFVGHPLLEELPLDLSKTAAKANLGVTGKRVIAMLPGSRKQEIFHHTPILTEAFRMLQKKHPDVIALVPALSELPQEWYQPFVDIGARLVYDDASVSIVAADAAAVASGTATLQTALLGTPLTVLYRTSPITFAIGKRVVKVPYIALANLVMNDLVAPERIQNDATPKRLAKDLSNLMGEAGVEQVKKFATLRSRLGGVGASQRVAEWILELAAKQ